MVHLDKSLCSFLFFVQILLQNYKIYMCQKLTSLLLLNHRAVTDCSVYNGVRLIAYTTCVVSATLYTFIQVGNKSIRSSNLIHFLNSTLLKDA